MNRLLSFWVILASLVIAACGGSNTVTDPGGGAPPGPTVATIELITSSPQIQSDVTGQTNVSITAIAKDLNNNVVAGVNIIFSADSGSLTVLQAITDPNGVATATLSNGPGDPSNRTITLTATEGTVTATISIDVIGTVLSITGPPALAQNDSAIYTVVLEDSSGVGIAGETVDVTSANGNTLSAATLTTGVDGDAQANCRGSHGRRARRGDRVCRRSGCRPG